MKVSSFNIIILDAIITVFEVTVGGRRFTPETPNSDAEEGQGASK